MSDSLNLPVRPRRLRLQAGVRAMLQRVTLRRSDIIVPVFVREGTGIRQEVSSMPGVYQMSLDVATDWLAERADEGFGAYLVFGVIDREKKDADRARPPSMRTTSSASSCASRSSSKIPMVGITDLCFCEYTSHGHCGPMTDDQSTVKNDETVAAAGARRRSITPRPAPASSPPAA